MNKTAKTALALLTSCSLLGQALPATALAAALTPASALNTAADDERHAVAHATEGLHPGVLLSYEVTYSDKLFAQPAPNYSHALAQASLGLSLASTSSLSSDPAHYADEITQFLKACGFEQVEVNGDWTNAGPDTIGVAVAYRDTTVNEKDVRIFAIAIRGFGYQEEWASSFTLGTEGAHQGFADSAARAREFADAYVAKHLPTDGRALKLWTTGYSRGGSVDNLLAASLLREGKLAGATIASNDVYCYTFEAPQTVPSNMTDLNDSRYASIHNVANPDDWLGNCMGLFFGFKHYGQDHDLSGAAYPSASEWGAKALRGEAWDEFVGRLKKINPEITYGAPDFAEQSFDLATSKLTAVENGRSQAEYGPEFGAWFIKALGLNSREDYVSSGAQASMRSIGSLFGGHADRATKLMSYVKSHAMSAIAGLIFGGLGTSSLDTQSVNEQLAAWQEVIDALPDGEDAHALRTAAVVNPSTVSAARGLIKNVSEQALASVINKLLCGGLADQGVEYDAAEIEHLSAWGASVAKRVLGTDFDLSPAFTLAENGRSVITAHIPEVTAAYLDTFASRQPTPDPDPDPDPTPDPGPDPDPTPDPGPDPDPTPEPETGWKESNGSWTYLEKGVAKTGWLYDAGSWYYFNPNGTMRSGWLCENGTWFYLNTQHNGRYGAMVTGWLFADGSWYYLYPTSGSPLGALAVSTVTPDGCRVDASGRWIG